MVICVLLVVLQGFSKEVLLGVMALYEAPLSTILSDKVINVALSGGQS